MLETTHSSVIKAAIENILHRLAIMPASDEVEAVRAKGRDYLHQAATWTATYPAAEDKERLMKSALALHAAVEELERRRT